MKRKFTYLATALVLLTFLAIPMGMRGQTRDVETFTFSELGYSNGDDVTTVEGDNVTLTFAQGEGNNPPKYYTSGTGVRMYTNNTLEVALNNQEGETRITAIDFTFSGTYTGSLQNWTGSETSVSFTNTASGQARIQVIAVTFSEGGVAPTTYTVTYNANVAGVAPVVDTYVEGANVTLRDANTFTNDGYTFSEWNTQADGDGDAYDAGDVIENIQANIELYAIWAVSNEQWVLTNLADLTSTDVFVIVGNGYAMTNNKGTSSAPATSAVNIEGSMITCTVAETIQWTVSGDATNGYTFYPKGSTETWLYCSTTANSGSNNNIRVGTGNRKVFELNSNNYLMTKDDFADRYLSIYVNNDGVSQDWRGYTNTNLCPEMSFYKKVTGGVIPPSISANNVEIAFDATEGSIAYTINNSVAGGTLTATTENDWLTLGTVGTTVPFTCTANGVGTERTATVTLTYTYDRATVTKDVTVTQAGNPNATMTIAEVRAQGTGSVATEGTVTSITGSTNKTVYIQDATAAIVVYGNFTAAVGDEIRVAGTLTTYHGLMEITNPTVTIISQGNTIDPELMTIAEINASTNQGWYIRVEEATVTRISGSGNSQNTTIAQGNDTILVYGNLGVTVAMNDIISLNGNIGNHDGVQIANPQNVEVQQNINPAILLNTYEIAVFAEGGEGDIDVTYQNFVVNNEKLSVSFYDENGVNQVTCDWITVEFDANNNVHYIVEANEGAARMAYFKVEYDVIEPEDIKGYVTGGEPVYSDLVTVSQAAAPTFAALPFEFDGGRAAIDTIDGLYQEGLGSDYNSSPKLRFDSTDDYLLLQFNEVPGKLTFEIKGNSFSGGTFKVQTSEDGVTYTDLEVYGNLTSTVQPESFNLGENVRYVKWVYTVKVSGNVALGKIKLLKPATMYNLTVEPFENLEIFTFIGGDESEMALEGAGTIQVAEGDQVMLSISANEGYEIQSLMVDGVEHVNDIADDMTYTFNMPNHNVTISATAVAVVPFEPATYTLVTSYEQLELGKSYIIVGSKTIEGETYYYAMGEQRTYNRAGVAISVEDGVAQVNSPEVHEFIIDEYVEEDLLSRGFITGGEFPGCFIYDTDETSPGYLYAASSTANQLKTKDTLDWNCEWEIVIDSTGFSIHGRYGFTHNVMQFNYNNNNPAIFSCYETASQSPVYLYVKDETPSVVTQIIALNEGWNWVSIGIAVEDPVEMLDMLKASLGENATEIQSYDYTTEFDGEEWFGDLDEEGVYNEQMYLINAANDCTIELTGMPAVADEYEITINPGWNWIGFPSAVAIDVVDALSGFDAAEGDEIQDVDLTTEFDGEDWFGDLETFEPGRGLLYNNTTDETKTLIFRTGAKKAARHAIPNLGTKKQIAPRVMFIGEAKSTDGNRTK